MKAYVMAAAAAIVLAGCGGGGADPAASAQPPETASASPTVSKRPVAEIASIVAQQEARIEKLASDLEGCPTVDEIRQVACAFIVQRAPLDGQLTVKAFKGLMGATMPDEVSLLFNQTYSAAMDLSFVDAAPCDDTDLNAECSQATDEARRAVTALQAKFDGWDPYQ